MKIEAFKILGLFHTFNYDFKVDSMDSIFLITGPNGYGKTTILNILYALSRKDLFYLYELPFELLEVQFDGGVRIVINSVNANIRRTQDTARQQNRTLSFKWLQNNDEISELKLDQKLYNKAISRYREEEDRHPFYRVDAPISLSEYFVAQPQRLDYLYKGQDKAQMFLMQLSSLNISMLPSNRITKERDAFGHNVDSIDAVSSRLADLLNSTYVKYLEDVNRSNSSVYDKLLIQRKAAKREEYELKASTLTPKLLQLNRWGLTAEKEVRSFDSDHAEVLSVYIEELENNIALYDKIYSKLLLFSELLSAKMFTNKRIGFSPKNGISAISTVDDAPLPLTKLSSGEQHEIIMLYRSIFTASENSILIIDEPENSLHVAWQNMYVSDIVRICEQLNIQCIIATHSPHIIGGRYEECFDLYEYSESLKGV